MILAPRLCLITLFCPEPVHEMLALGAILVIFLVFPWILLLARYLLNIGQDDANGGIDQRFGLPMAVA